MQTRKSFFKTPLLVALLGCTMAFAVACGDDDDTENPAPSGGSNATGGTGGSSAGKSNGGSSNSAAGQKSDAGEGNSPSTGGTTNGGGGEPTKNDAGNGPGPDAGGGPDQDCSDEANVGCFCGKPSSLKEFLNACPTTGCEPFDNGTLTSLPSSGVLPELP